MSNLSDAQLYALEHSPKGEPPSTGAAARRRQETRARQAEEREAQRKTALVSLLAARQGLTLQQLAHRHGWPVGFARDLLFDLAEQDQAHEARGRWHHGPGAMPFERPTPVPKLSPPKPAPSSGSEPMMPLAPRGVRPIPGASPRRVQLGAPPPKPAPTLEPPQMGPAEALVSVVEESTVPRDPRPSRDPGTTAGCALSSAQQGGSIEPASITAEVPASPAQTEAETVAEDLQPAEPREQVVTEESEAPTGPAPLPSGEGAEAPALQPPAAAPGPEAADGAQTLVGGLATPCRGDEGEGYPPAPVPAVESGGATGPETEEARDATTPLTSEPSSQVAQVAPCTEEDEDGLELQREVGAPPPGAGGDSPAPGGGGEEAAGAPPERDEPRPEAPRGPACAPAAGAGRVAPTRESLAAWLIRRRTELELSQSELGRRCKIPSPQTVISKLELGVQKKTLYLEDLERVLGPYTGPAPRVGERGPDEGPARPEQAAAYVAAHPGCTSTEVAEHLGIQRNRATQLLREAGCRKQGRTNGARYFPPRRRGDNARPVDAPGVPGLLSASEGAEPAARGGGEGKEGQPSPASDEDPAVAVLGSGSSGAATAGSSSPEPREAYLREHLERLRALRDILDKLILTTESQLDSHIELCRENAQLRQENERLRGRLEAARRELEEA